MPNKNKNENDDEKFEKKTLLGKMSDKEKEILKELIREYKDIFEYNGEKLGRTDKIKYKIEIEENKEPIAQKRYKVTEDKTKYIKKEIEQLSNMGKIRKSWSAWASPNQKTGGSVQFNPIFYKNAKNQIAGHLVIVQSQAIYHWIPLDETRRMVLSIGARDIILAPFDASQLDESNEYKFVRKRVQYKLFQRAHEIPITSFKEIGRAVIEAKLDSIYSTVKTNPEFFQDISAFTALNNETVKLTLWTCEEIQKPTARGTTKIMEYKIDKKGKIIRSEKHKSKGTNRGKNNNNSCIGKLNKLVLKATKIPKSENRYSFKELYGNIVLGQKMGNPLNNWPEQEK
ncbi:hypothetical protein GLOIN_2v1768072 [Rhizophagus irregularis DAOM 181602=DAOM 197198]|uniref:Uncharacterized protein n=1 Tax=Rhizophagus irregularis (strain DAOM 181602 / DAOM 197198 / MUCL 43194) TaxID=747089 RepID=A0A2P4QI13_RHIID|nr:hypothetical protein GLOIN_2v1768072 [Rhizophagus irregularis DAOM 181602=DAOM 197198]POG77264.1 hypothetical protein GLOIN_2v1768072 [Rhizophagus irregularis DAOM 181602=DAOM 197198]|eukprot:XP_025184130.1 hypothetical protein GLOIN_2v1768072 [Rhizophagus irregularis DAOM 181602=DAOM 197198]